MKGYTQTRKRQMIDECWILCCAMVSPLSTPWGPSIKTSEGLLFVSFLQMIYFESWEPDKAGKQDCVLPPQSSADRKLG